MYVAKNVANLRANPDPHSERINQVLFNAKCKVDKEEEEWLFCQVPDGTKGWMRKYYTTEEQYRVGRLWRVRSIYAPAYDSTCHQLVTKFTFNTRIYGDQIENSVVTEWSDGRKLRLKESDLEPEDTEKDFANLGDLAKKFIGIPYLWGGISSFGLDCSGFTQTLFDYFGTSLPRNSGQQKKVGQKVTVSGDRSVLKEKPSLGDLLFFPGHVGIYLQDGLMIHSCSRENGVAITDLLNDSSYSKYLRGELTVVKRVMGA